MSIGRHLTHNMSVRRDTYNLSVTQTLTDTFWVRRCLTGNISVKQGLTDNFPNRIGLTDNSLVARCLN